MSRTFRILKLIIAIVPAYFYCASQLFAALVVDEDFLARPNGQVHGVDIQANGKILAIGYFTKINAISRNYFARLNVDGSVDESFDPAPNNFPTHLRVLPNGKIFVIGFFSEIAGMVSLGGGHRGFARLNSDGSFDSSFSLSVTPQNSLDKVFLQPDGQILVVGDFTNIEGQLRTKLARLKNDWSLDSTFNTTITPDSEISTLALQKDQKILITGDINFEDGLGSIKLARLNSDGSLDTEFNAQIFDEITSIEEVANNKILVGGNLRFVNGEFRSGLVRLNADGSTDETFALTNNDASTRFTLDPDGKIWANGCCGENSAENLLRYQPYGTKEPEFKIQPGGKLSFLDRGRILVHGTFTTLNSTYAPYMAMLKPDKDKLCFPVNNTSGATSLICL